MGTWLAESLRVTAFPLPTLQPPTQPEWWSEIVGSPPEKQTVDRKSAQYLEEGEVQMGKLVLAVLPGRIDWSLVPPAAVGDKFPSVGSFLDSLAFFKELMLRWFEKAPQSWRLAFGAVLLLPVQDRRSGYEKLSLYLPSVQLDAKGSSEFSYQINRPRPSRSGISGLEINRLSKWSVSARQAWEIGPISPGGSPPLVRQTYPEPPTACRLELDINTTQVSPTELQADKVIVVFKEVIELGIEIVLKGDVQ
ncbi:MAG TPA: hypothetical protein VMX16_04235 [Terriglobia bacterium]|nr:hypothetical protein [Terriglobia bacterium]